jgi:hypothetical protein
VASVGFADANSNSNSNYNILATAVEANAFAQHAVGKFEANQPRGLRVFGYSRESTLGMWVSSLIVPIIG